MYSLLLATHGSRPEQRVYSSWLGRQQSHLHLAPPTVLNSSLFHLHTDFLHQPPYSNHSMLLRPAKNKILQHTSPAAVGSSFPQSPDCPLQLIRYKLPSIPLHLNSHSLGFWIRPSLLLLSHYADY